MVWLALLIASLALVIAVVSFLRTGGSADVRRQLDALSAKTDEVVRSVSAKTDEAFRSVSAKTDEVVHAVGTRTDGVREKAADAVSRLEQTIRGKPSDSGQSS